MRWQVVLAFNSAQGLLNGKGLVAGKRLKSFFYTAKVDIVVRYGGSAAIFRFGGQKNVFIWRRMKAAGSLSDPAGDLSGLMMLATSLMMIAWCREWKQLFCYVYFHHGLIPYCEPSHLGNNT